MAFAAHADNIRQVQVNKASDTAIAPNTDFNANHFNVTVTAWKSDIDSVTGFVATKINNFTVEPKKAPNDASQTSESNVAKATISYAPSTSETVYSDQTWTGTNDLQVKDVEYNVGKYVAPATT